MHDVDALLHARGSTRVPFDPSRRVAPADLARILDAARWAPTPHNMQNFEIVVVDDPAALEALGAIRSPHSEAFVRENYAQLSFTEAELEQKRVGLLAAAFPSSWRPRGGLDLDAAMREPEARLTDTLKGAPALILVLFDERRRAPASAGDALGLLGLGCVLENMWLAATSLGLAAQVVSVVSGAAVEPVIQRQLGIPAHLRIAFALRLGYPSIAASPAPRVRREVAAFTHKNRYGAR